MIDYQKDEKGRVLNQNNENNARLSATVTGDATVACVVAKSEDSFDEMVFNKT